MRPGHWLVLFGIITAAIVVGWVVIGVEVERVAAALEAIAAKIH